MFRFLIRRVIGALVILLVISAVTFFLFYAIPRDPAPPPSPTARSVTRSCWNRCG
ncbi:hypothetical protein SGLAM104S_03240 [Streptomyces glaucescens]